MGKIPGMGKVPGMGRIPGMGRVPGILKQLPSGGRDRLLLGRTNVARRRLLVVSGFYYLNI